MAAMNEQDRIDCGADWMRENKLAISVTKDQLQAAIADMEIEQVKVENTDP